MKTDTLPTFILSTKENSYKISRWQERGLVRKVTANLYTSNMHDDLDAFIQRRLFELVGLVYPGAIIADRSAFEMLSTVSN